MRIKMPIIRASDKEAPKDPIKDNCVAYAPSTGGKVVPNPYPNLNWLMIHLQGEIYGEGSKDVLLSAGPYAALQNDFKTASCVFYGDLCSRPIRVTVTVWVMVRVRFRVRVRVGVWIRVG